MDAANSSLGNFPAQRNTVRAEVLARLISSEVMTGMDAVFDASTTRLAAVVHVLRKKYRWSIDSAVKIVSTNDGRTAEISAYRLPEATVKAAMSQGGTEYCASVKTARQALRMARKA